jgi:hypothetical protein
MASAPHHQKADHKAKSRRRSDGGPRPAAISCVQNATIELHTWGATIPNLAQPDRFVLDLDPDPTLPWDKFRETHRACRGDADRQGRARGTSVASATV